jgi:Spy/CpxP family protein refolding chaperone
MIGLLDISRSVHRFALATGLGAAVALSGPVLASAQDDGGTPHHEWHGRGHGHRHGRMEAHFERMARELSLTPEQEAQIRAVLDEAREERRALRDQFREGRRDAARALHARVQSRIEGILTPEQQQRARELRARHREARMERRLEHMKERLGLTDAQAAEVRSILERSHAEHRRILESTERGSDARRSAMQALHTQTRDALRGVLTPEQARELESHRPFGRHRRPR